MNPKVQIENVPVVVHTTEDVRLPETYDMSSTLVPPANQGNCGSCWAIAAVQVTEDRLRLSGVRVPSLSYQHVNDCAANCVTYKGRDGCSNNCNGGFLTSAFEFIQHKGVLATSSYGAKYNDVHGSAHIDAAGSVTAKCNLPKGASELPRWKIRGYYHVMLYPDLFGIPNAREVYPPLSAEESDANARNIMIEIHRHGPVACCLNMFSDFVEYASQRRGEEEVYWLGWQTPEVLVPPVGDTEWSASRPGPGGLKFVTGHAVSIVGWGVTRSSRIPYWVVRNSWGKRGGYVKMKRGVNCSGMESDIEAPRVVASTKNLVNVSAAKKGSWWGWR